MPGQAALPGQGRFYLGQALVGQGSEGGHHLGLPLLSKTEVLGLKGVGYGLVQISGYLLVLHGGAFFLVVRLGQAQGRGRMLQHPPEVQVEVF